MPISKAFSKIVLFSALLLVASCATSPSGERSASEPQSSDHQVKYHYALEAMKQGQLESAEPQMLALTRQHPHFAGPWLNLCIIYTETARFTEAEKACQQSLKQNGKMNPARNQLGIVYRRQGRFEDARRIYQMALQQNPEYAQVHYNLGVLFDLYLQDRDLAIEHYQRHLDLTGNKDKKVKRWISQLNKELARASQGPAR